MINQKRRNVEVLEEWLNDEREIFGGIEATVLELLFGRLEQVWYLIFRVWSLIFQNFYLIFDLTMYFLHCSRIASSEKFISRSHGHSNLQHLLRNLNTGRWAIADWLNFYRTPIANWLTYGARRRSTCPCRWSEEGRGRAYRRGRR